MQLHDQIKKEIDAEQESINKIEFGKIEISVTVQDGQPYVIEVGTNRKKKCKTING
ncbi:MAG: hypothetical protein WC834_00210 [Eubacteriales bacterium]